MLGLWGLGVLLLCQYQKRFQLIELNFWHSVLLVSM